MKPAIQRILIVFFIFVLAAILSGYILFKTYTGFHEQLLERTALLLGEAVEETLRNSANRNLEQLSAAEKRRLQQLMTSMTTETGNIIHILLINTQNTILLSSDRSVEGHKYKSAEEIAQLQSDIPQVLHKTWDDSIRIIDAIIPLKNAENNLYGHLRIVLSHEGISSIFKDLSSVFIPLLIVFATLLMLSAFMLGRSYNKPIHSFRQAAQRFISGDFDQKVKYGRKDEFTDTFALINKSIEEASVTKESYKKIEKRITVLLQAIDESIILIDPTETAISYNIAAMKLLRCPKDRDFPKYFRKISSKNPDLRRIIIDALNGREDTSGKQIVLFLSDEEHLLLRVSAQVFREKEQNIGVLLTLKDIHVLNELEHNLQRSMKFGLIATLASSINHEIRTPLSSLAMRTEIIRKRLEKFGIKPSDDAWESITILKNELDRIHRIIDQFLTLARSRKANLSKLNINSVVNDVLLLVQQQAIELNITVKSELNENIDYIYGDPDQLKQVILNIVLNGFQAIERDGTIYIRTRQSKNRIHVIIQDTGKGMSPEVRKRLYELYFTTKSGGGGIGLAISRNIMQAHEGRISFDSVEGKGTIFTLDFPNKDMTKTIKKLMDTSVKS